MKNFLVGLFTLLCVAFAAGSILQVTGVIDIENIIARIKNESPEGSVFYVRFMDSFFIIDEAGNVIANTLTAPTDIPEVQDMKFNDFILGEAAAPADEALMDYVINVCTYLESASLEVSYISASDGTVTLYFRDDLSVMLGENEDTALKIDELKDIYVEMEEYSGTLDMEVLDSGRVGYTFKLAE